MTAAQRDYLTAHGLDPWSLEWSTAVDVGIPEWGQTEVAQLPNGNLLLAHGGVVFREGRSGS